MSEFFAEATVRIQPDLTGFATQLKSQLKAIVDRIEARPPKVRIAPALTRNFVSDLRRQVNEAVIKAEAGVKPIKVRAAIEPFQQGQLRELQNASLAAAPRVPRVNTGVFGQTARQATQADDAVRKLFNTEKLLNSAFGQSATVLNSQGKAIARNAELRAAGARSVRQTTTALVQETDATRALERAIRSLAAVRLTEEGTRSRAMAIRRAEGTILNSIVLADEERNTALQQQSRSLRDNLTILDRHNQELTQNSGKTATAARHQEQLRRGVLATSLSFAGIRGATLAASASFLIGAASISVFAKALQSASKFTDQLNVFRATTQATAADLEQVRKQARLLGADISLPGVSAADAAEAMTELAKAGLSVQDSIAGARGVLQLATAAAIDNAQATQLVANALNSFQLAGRDATHVADVFASAANAAQGSIVDIGLAFQQAAAAGRQVGLSFEDTAVFLTELAQAGLKGSDAGTSFRTALIRLINPSKQAAAEMKSLGIQVRDAQGRFRPDVFAQITEATRDLAPAARDAFIALVGGQDAFRAITVLGRKTLDQTIALRDRYQQQGEAARVAAARNQGLRGSLDALSSTLETAGSRIGQGVTPQVQGLVGGVTQAAAAMAASDQVARTFSGAMQSVDIASSALVGTLHVLGPPLLTLASALEKVTNAVGVPTIIGAVAAYKLFPVVLKAATGPARALSITFDSLVSTMRPASFAVQGIRTAFVSLATSLPLIQLGLAAAGAALLFFLTRETEAEAATRRFKQATEDLAAAQERLITTQRTARDASLSLNSATLGVLDAQAAVRQARRQIEEAPRGTFERTRAQLALKVALDNVRIAQINLKRAQVDADNEAIVAANASRLRTEALQTEIKAISDRIDAEKRSQGLTGRGPVAPALRAGLEAKAIQNVVKSLRDRAQAERAEGTAQSIALAKRLELLANLAEATKRLPTRHAIQIAIQAPNIDKVVQQLIVEFGVTGRKAQAALLQTLTGGLEARLNSALGKLIKSADGLLTIGMHRAGQRGALAMAQGIQAGLGAINKVISQAFGLLHRDVSAQLAKETQGQLAGLQRRASDITIAGGGNEAVLANLRAQEALARQILESARRRFALHKVSAKTVQNAQQALIDILNQEAQIHDAIRQKAEDNARKAKETADKVKAAREKADQALLDLFQRRRDIREERITRAQDTSTVRDDIARNEQLRALILRQIKQIQAQVKTTDLRTSAVRELRRASRDLAAEIRNLKRQRAQEIADRVAESIQLDIEFAQTRGNQNAEIKARQREIARLRQLQKHTKSGTVEYKRLRNAIAEQEKAIADLRKQTASRNDALGKAMFEFLQRQQGFASNLLGNLIPTGLTGGLVGNVSPGAQTAIGPSLVPSAQRPLAPGVTATLVPVDRSLATVGADKTTGPTRGQATVQVDLLRQILLTLHEIQRGRAHPEARRSHAHNHASFDVF